MKDWIVGNCFIVKQFLIWRRIRWSGEKGHPPHFYLVLLRDYNGEDHWWLHHHRQIVIENTEIEFEFTEISLIDRSEIKLKKVTTSLTNVFRRVSYIMPVWPWFHIRQLPTLL